MGNHIDEIVRRLITGATFVVVGSVFPQSSFAFICNDSPNAPILPQSVTNAIDTISLVHEGKFQAGSPILSSKKAEFGQLLEFAAKNPVLFRFGTGLRDSVSGCPDEKTPSYDNVQYHIISESEAFEANRLSDEISTKFLSSYPPMVTDQLYTSDPKTLGNTLGMRDFSHIGGWYLQVSVNPSGSVIESTEGKFFVPFAVTLTHELRHVEQFGPGEGTPASVGAGFPELPFTNYDKLENTTKFLRAPSKKEDKVRDVSFEYISVMNEMVPTLGTVIDLDTVYKKIHNIPLENEANYSAMLPSEKGSGVPLGKLANTFRKLVDQYGSIQKALMSPEAIQFLEQYYSQRSCPIPEDYLK